LHKFVATSVAATAAAAIVKVGGVLRVGKGNEWMVVDWRQWCGIDFEACSLCEFVVMDVLGAVCHGDGELVIL